MQPGELRFGDSVLFVAAPIFVVVLAVIAISTLMDPHARLIGVVAAVLEVLLVRGLLRTTYVAVVGPDGSLTFKTATGSTRTTVADVRRIGTSRRGGRALSWVFVFEGGSAQLGNDGGRDLARFIVDHNPAVEYPDLLRRVWPRWRR